MEILENLHNLREGHAISFVSERVAQLIPEDVRLAVEEVTQALVENRPEETTKAPGFAVVAISARDMLLAIKHYPGWIEQGKAEAVATNIIPVWFDDTPAIVYPAQIHNAMKQAKVAAATRQNSGSHPNYMVNEVSTTLVSEDEIWNGGNVSGAVYSGGFIVSVAGLSPGLNHEIAEAIVITSFDKVQERLDQLDTSGSSETSVA